MGFLNNIKDRLRGESDDYYDDDQQGNYDQYYDDYQDDDRSQRGARDSRGDDSTSLLGNTSRPEAESVSVYTRSGRHVDDGGYSPSRGGAEAMRPVSDFEPAWTPASRDDRPYRTQPTDAPAAQQAQPGYTDPDATSVAPHVTTPGDVGLTAVPRMSSGKLPPYVLKPTAYDDVQMVVRRVRTNQPVVLSFKQIKIETAKRILDFCFGLACGLGGSVQELGDRVFVVLPAGIELSQSDIDKLDSDGLLGR